MRLPFLAYECNSTIFPNKDIFIKVMMSFPRNFPSISGPLFFLPICLKARPKLPCHVLLVFRNSVFGRFVCRASVISPADCQPDGTSAPACRAGARRGRPWGRRPADDRPRRVRGTRGLRRGPTTEPQWPAHGGPSGLGRLHRLFWGTSSPFHSSQPACFLSSKVPAFSVCHLGGRVLPPTRTLPVLCGQALRQVRHPGPRRPGPHGPRPRPGDEGSVVFLKGGSPSPSHPYPGGRGGGGEVGQRKLYTKKCFCPQFSRLQFFLAPIPPPCGPADLVEPPLFLIFFLPFLI